VAVKLLQFEAAWEHLYFYLYSLLIVFSQVADVQAALVSSNT